MGNIVVDSRENLIHYLFVIFSKDLKSFIRFIWPRKPTLTDMHSPLMFLWSFFSLIPKKEVGGFDPHFIPVIPLLNINILFKNIHILWNLPCSECTKKGLKYRFIDFFFLLLSRVVEGGKVNLKFTLST